MYSVIHLSPLNRTKGGISTVVKNYKEKFKDQNFKIITVETHCDGSIAQKIKTMFLAFIKLIQMMFTTKVSVLHVHIGDMPSPIRKFFICIPAFFFGNKKIIHVHGAELIEQYKQATVLEKKIVEVFFSQFDAAICLSNSWKDSLTNIYRFKKIFVVNNSVPLPTDKRMSNSSSTINILFLGKIGDRKGIFDLVDVVDDLVSSDVNIQLNIGGDGDIDRLSREITGRNLSDYIKYKGWLTGDSLKKEFLQNDIFVLPSYAEGMPMSILEAMSYGLAVVSTDVGGIPELLEDDVTGLMVAPGDKRALKEKIILLINDNEKRSSLANCAREEINNHYSLSSHLENIKSIYEELVITCDGKNISKQNR